ncbi:MAG: tetratricopeptide repeat protein [Candidatus Heimdallarchaeaceae archaeon]
MFYYLKILGTIELEKGNLDKAEKQPEKTLELNEYFTLGWENLAFVRTQLGNKKELRKQKRN